MGARIGIKIDPDGIHVMKKSRYSGLYGDYSQNGHPGIGPQQEVDPHGQHDEHHGRPLEALALPAHQVTHRNTQGAVVLGMVYNYLPFMILPIYSVIVKLDGSLVEAARDLGADGFNVFRRVILPLSLPGVLSGITMVFVPSVST